MKIRTNNNWELSNAPFFTIITPIYNRRQTLSRTIKSVETQTFTDFEYILIDDGSQDTCDDIILDFMNKTNIPVMYIKKKNGGVHTARNIGYEHSRGKLIICIDSDDELLPEACKVFFDEWNSIPIDKQSSYWQMKALCIDERGIVISDEFPKDINSKSRKEAVEFFSKSKGEQLGCRVSTILKNRKFPEPQKVTFVDENVLWTQLEQEYNSWAVNTPVRVYHTEGDNHLTNQRKKSIQSCYNALWNSAYAINNKERMLSSKIAYVKMIMRYGIMKAILSSIDKSFCLENRLIHSSDRCIYYLLYIFTIPGGHIYKKKRMIL